MSSQNEQEEEAHDSFRQLCAVIGASEAGKGLTNMEVALVAIGMPPKK